MSGGYKALDAFKPHVERHSCWQECFTSHLHGVSNETLDAPIGLVLLSGSGVVLSTMPVKVFVHVFIDELSALICVLILHGVAFHARRPLSAVLTVF